MPSKCSLLLRRKPIQPNYPHIFKTFKTQCALNILNTKVTKNWHRGLISLTYAPKGSSPILSWNWSQFIHFYLLKFWTKFGYDPLWTQDINWTYLKSSGEVQNVFWTPYGPSIYICVQGFPKQQTKACSKSTTTTLYGMKKYMTLLEFNITTDVSNFAKKYCMYHSIWIVSFY